MRKIKMYLEAVVVITVILALVLPSSAVITSNTTSENKNLQYDAYATPTLFAINKELPGAGPFSRGEDILVSSDNPDEDDENPRMIVNDDGVIVVTYEKEIDPLTKFIPISYSDDNGDSWTIQFEVDSSENEGSGFMESPDVAYSPVSDEFFWVAIDPVEDSTYHVFTGRIPGDIANANTMPMQIYSWIDSEDYIDGANTFVGEWMVTLNTDTSHEIVAAPALHYDWYDWDEDIWYTPNEFNPNWAMGMYYDGQSVLETAPASKPEMDTGENRMYMVMETYDEDAGYSKISYKATYTDLDPESDTFLFILGGGPSDMDKYADIEVWPWQMFIAENAEDPDVSAQGSRVAVVYSQDGDAKCKASDDDGETWEESTVAVGAGYPCVYVVGEMIYVAYVSGEDLYLVDSDNLGQSWSTPVQINDLDGFVVEQPGTADLGAFGVVWTDDRVGENDVYFEYVELLGGNPPTAPDIDGPSSGDSGTLLTYTFTSTDPDGDQVSYYIEWDDGDTTGWTALQDEGTPCSESHTYAKGDIYTITAKAKDEGGLVGPSSTFKVDIPKSRAVVFNSWFLQFLQQFPFFRYILGI